ncbi:MAG TPA: cysteine hydrolase [Dehalococcoidia bacterium]|nr:cysteine hydrolase [Dehalococcoidia bacterium]
MAEFPIVPDKTGMLFFDVLNVYLHPAEPEAQVRVAASGILPRLTRLGRICRLGGIAVFYAQADHRTDHRDFAALIADRGPQIPSGRGPGLTRSPIHGSGMRNAEIAPELEPEAADYVIKKHRWSAFFQTHLELSLRTAGIDTIILAGGSTEVGIASTAYSARDRDYNQIVIRDACTSNQESVNDFFMESVFPGFARVMTIDDLEGALGNR